MPMPGGMQQQFCLKWNNHQVNLLKVFARLLASEHFTDVVLAAEGRSIKAHRVVLSACSAYFEQLLADYNDRNGCPIIILKDVSFFDLTSIIEFMYKGEINVTQEKLGALLKTAENLKVKGLAEVSEDGQESSASQMQPPVTSTPVASTVQAMTQMNPEFHGGSFGHYPHSPYDAPPAKKKRGRPRLFDSPEGNHSPEQKYELPLPRMDPPEQSSSPCPRPSVRRMGSVSLPSAPSSSTQPPDFVKEEAQGDREITESPVMENGDDFHKEPSAKMKANQDITFDGGIVFYCGMPVVKLNNYLQHGARAQFWDEPVTHRIMDAVRNKALDMKTGADLLGVSYGTLYGRYRETFGYLKHAWSTKKKEKETTPIKAPTPVPSVAATEPVTIDKRILDALLRKDLTLGQASAMLGLCEIEIYSQVEQHLRVVGARSLAQEADDRSSDTEGRLRIDSDESSQELIPQDLKLKPTSVENAISSRID